MKVTLFSFAKKDNSTARPTMSSGTEYDCYLKDGTSVVDPVIVLDLPSKTSFTKYTYAYIQEFGRYYFVRDMTADGLLWDVSLVCDVLATYKSEIGNSNLYVLRSSYTYDGDLVDTYYPIGVTHTNSRVTAYNPLTGTSNSAAADVTKGCFIIGTVGTSASNSNYGSVTYHAMPRSSLNKFVQSLLGQVADGENGFTLSDMSIALQKSIIDPLQYIKSCIWVPVDYTNINNVIQGSSLNVFGWTVGSPSDPVYCKDIVNNPPQTIFTTTLTINKHPLAATRGIYMNTEPFSRYQLLYPPFGLFDLDTSVISQASTLTTEVILDLITGSATLRVWAESAGKFLINTKSQVGVPIDLTQSTHDYIGAATGFAGSIMGMVGSAATGNIMGASMSAMGMVGSVTSAMRPAASSIGGNGGYSDLYGLITLLAQFYHMPEEDNSHAGRPLCQNKTLSTIPGYQKIMDGDVAINGTAGEQAAIKAYLEGGYFYE